MSDRLSRREWLTSSALCASGLLGLSLPSAAFPDRTPLRAPERDAVPATARDEVDVQPSLRREDVRARLYANENPHGPSDRASSAIREAVSDSSRYPFEERRELTQALADLEGVPTDLILLGAGSTQLLLAAAMSLGRDDGEILDSEPTFFSMVSFAERTGTRMTQVPVDENYQEDLEALREAVTSETSLVYLVNPHNPLGTSIASDDMEAFCQRVSPKVPIMVDEAYIDYHPEGTDASMSSLIEEGYDVVVAKTFSKIHAFAGMRVGYLVAQPERLDQIRAYSTGGFDLSKPAVVGAMAALDDQAFMEDSLERNEEGRELLYRGLEDLGYEYISSDANFVIFPVDRDSEALSQALSERGVLIRPFHFLNQHWCRVSIGTPDELRIFLRALSEI